MAADGNRMSTLRPLQACNLCKSRKKKCDKSVPSCGYCASKYQDCIYGQVSFQRNSASLNTNNHHVAQPSIPLVSTRVILSAKQPLQDHSTDGFRREVYLEVYRIIRENGHFVDDISACYFQGFHHQLPIISRTSFYNSLATSETAPPASSSLLLLAMCLFTRTPTTSSESSVPVGSRTGDRQALYLATKSLYAQVQVCGPPSVPMVQVGMLLAMYEYTKGHPHNAFMTITCSVRMAYAIGIHKRHFQIDMPREGSNPASLLEVEEAANTWWGIVICERTFFSEVGVHRQPLLSAYPAGDDRLPIEAKILDQLDVLEPGSVPNIPLSCLTFPDLGGFVRAAQATCFLDQVHKGIEIEDIDSRLLLLSRLDINIQSFLSLVMPQCQREPGIFCSAMNITIRTLFILHWHVVEQLEVTAPKYESREAWISKSNEALETITKMVIDIADLLVATPVQGTTTYMVDTMPPQYPYIAQAVLTYVHSKKHGGDLAWVRKAEDILQVWLEKFSKRRL